MPERITSACLRSQRSEMNTRRKPSRSASTPSSIPWAGVRPSVSRANWLASELTAPAMMNALKSSVTRARSALTVGASGAATVIGFYSSFKIPMGNHRIGYGIFVSRDSEATPAKRGPRPRFTREGVLEAALRVIDAVPPDAFTMRRVADELGMGVMTLYGYVRNKEEILEGV